MGTRHYLLRFLPMRDLAGYSTSDLRKDLGAAAAVTVMSVPQGVAYATIAGLPPAMGLYAATLPTIVGSLFRSSRYAITGPTNAVSLLVGTAVAASTGSDPVTAAITLAFMVGVIHLAAGLLNLGGLVDYISTAVVAGYITGAGLLIAAGQLHNVTNTEGGGLYLYGTLVHWVTHLSGWDPLSTLLALGTASGLLVLRRAAPHVPSGIVAMTTGIALVTVFGLDDRLVVLGDLGSLPGRLPPLTTPDFSTMPMLVRVAVSVSVLSLVESNAVSRRFSSRTGQRVDANVDFVGQGLSNLVAAFTAGYPVSGSLARSSINYKDGARTRMAGTLAGVGVLVVVLFFGPVVERTPIASLAGLLLVIATDLIDVKSVRRIMSSRWSDRTAFLVTLVGTMVLPLDTAIDFGVIVSLALFLRRARLITTHDMAVDEDLRLAEVTRGHPTRRCHAVRVLHVEGSLFFGAANELRDAMDDVLADEDVRVLILRLKRSRGLDYTTARVLEETGNRLTTQGRQLKLVGMGDQMMDVMENTGVASRLGYDSLYPTQPGWFVAMNEALGEALDSVGDHECAPGGCPLAAYLQHRDDLARVER